MKVGIVVNGNNLNWEAVDCLSYTCVDCSNAEREARERGEVWDEEHNFECSNHTTVYFPNTSGKDGEIDNGETVAMFYTIPPEERAFLMGSESIADLLPWVIEHDTNSNAVCLHSGKDGEVPDEYLDEKYLKETRNPPGDESRDEVDEG